MVQVGDVVKFGYEQAKTGSTDRIVKVLGVRDTRLDPVLESTKRANQIRRSRYLVTAQQTDGQIRAFYTDEVGVNVKRLGWLQRTALWVTGVRFYR